MKISRKLLQLCAILIACSTVLLCLSVCYAQGEIDIRSKVRYSVFEKGQSAEFVVVYNADAAGTMDVSIKHFDGSVEDIGAYSLNAGINTVNVSFVPGKIGHYTLTATAGDVSANAMFAVVPRLGERRDSSQSVAALGAMNDETLAGYYDEYVNTIKLAGIHNVRDFSRIYNLADFDDNDEYIGVASRTAVESYMKAFENAGIKLLMMISDIPGEMSKTVVGTDGTTEIKHKLPDDMLEVYSFFYDLAKKYDGKVDYIQIFNETDGSGGANVDGPDLYASTLKAASLGITDSGADIKVVQNPFSAYAGFMDNYKRRVSQNGTVDFFDAYAEHWYTNSNAEANGTEFPVVDSTFRNYIDIAEDYESIKRPILFTEFGLRQPYTSETPTVKGNELTDEQATQGAQFVPTAFIKAAERGIDKAYWFKHSYYNENGISYGTMTYKKNEPYPVYSAISAYTNAVGNAKYVGKLKNLSDGVNGYYFEDTELKEGVICLWAQESATQTVNIPATTAIQIDLMGNETQISGGEKSIAVGPNMTYIRFFGVLDDTQIERANSYNRIERSKDLSDSQRVVLKVEYPDYAMTSTIPRLAAYGLKSSANTVTLRLYNFNNKAVSGNVEAFSELGWTISGGGNVNIPAMSETTMEFNIYCDGSADFAYESAIMFTFKSDSDSSQDTASKSVSYVKMADQVIPDSTETLNTTNWGEKYGWTGTGAISGDGNKITLNSDFSNATGKRTSGVKAKLKLDYADAEGFVFNYSADQRVEKVRIGIGVYEEYKGGFLGLVPKEEIFYSTLTRGVDNYGHMYDNISTEPKQAVVYWSDFKLVENEGTPDDGLLDPKNIKKIRITFDITDNTGAPTTVSYYIENFGPFTTGEFNDVAANIPTYDSSAYTLKGTVANAESAKFMVDKRVYDANIVGSEAQLSITLNPGTHDVKLMAYNKVGKSVTNETSIDVQSYDGQYVVSYDANDGHNAPLTELVNIGEQVTVSNIVPDRAGYSFAGWSTDRTTRVPDYTAGDQFISTTDTVLYAIWHKSDTGDVALSNGAFYAEGTRNVTIQGNIGADEEKREIRNITALVINGSGFESVNSDNLLYIGTTNIDYSGNYKIEFTIPSDKACDNMNVLMNIDGSVEEMPIESSTVDYNWVDFDTDVLYANNKILVRSRTNNIAKNGMPYVVLIAYYNIDDVLISAEMHNRVSDNGYNDIFVKSDKANDAVYARVFTWDSVNNMNPVGGNKNEGNVGTTGN